MCMFILDCFERDMIKNVLLSKRQLGTNHLNFGYESSGCLHGGGTSAVLGTRAGGFVSINQTFETGSNVSILC